MTTHHTLPPGQRATHILDTWDLGPAIQILREKKRISRRRAEAMACEYRRYLRLRAMFPHLPLPISRQVAPIWHAHLLHTQDYAAMCQEAGILFIHRHPFLANDDKAASRITYRQTVLPLYHGHFGKPPEQFWPTNSLD